VQKVVFKYNRKFYRLCIYILKCKSVDQCIGISVGANNYSPVRSLRKVMNLSRLEKSPVRKKGNRWIGILDGVNEIRSEARMRKKSKERRTAEVRIRKISIG